MKKMIEITHHYVLLTRVFLGVTRCAFISNSPHDKYKMLMFSSSRDPIHHYKNVVSYEAYNTWN